jgi:ATP-dependent DNA helicase DinG
VLARRRGAGLCREPLAYGYRSRTSQIEMAGAVAATMEASGRAMPEPAMFEAQRRPARRLRTVDEPAAGSDPESGAGPQDESGAGENTLIVEAAR